MNEKNQVAVDITGSAEGYKKANADALQDQQRTAAKMAENDARWRAEFDRQQDERNRARAAKEAEIERRWQAAQAERQKTAEAAAAAEQKAAEKTSESNERSIRTYTRLASAIGAATVALGAFAIRQAAQAERSENRFNAMYSLAGGASGFTRDQLSVMVDDMARGTRHSDEEIQDAMSRLMTFRNVSGDAFRDTMKVAAGLAEVMGGDLANGVETLGKALENPVQGLSALQRAGVAFSPVQKKMIQDMAEHGNVAGATALVLERLRESGFHKITDELNAQDGYTSSFKKATQATGELFEAIGKLPLIQKPVTAVTSFYAGMVSDMTADFQAMRDGKWFRNPQPGRRYIPAGAATPEERAAQERAARGAAQEARIDRELAAYNAKYSPEFWEEFARNESRGRQDWTDDDLRAAQHAAGKELARLEGMEKQRELADQAFARGITSPMAMWNADDPVGLTQEDVRRGELQFERLRDTGKESFYEIARAAEYSGHQVSRSLASMAMNGRMNFQDLTGAARAFAEELLAMQINKRFMAPMLQEGTSFLDSWLNPGQGYGTAGSADPTAGGTFLSGAWHSGGIVGRNAPGWRRVSPADFAGAPRFHEGGEVPAVLKAGEEVLTERDPRHRRNGGGINVSVQVINQTSMPVRAQASAPRMEGGRMLVDVVLTEARRDAGVRDQLRELLAPPQH